MVNGEVFFLLKSKKKPRDEFGSRYQALRDILINPCPR